MQDTRVFDMSMKILPQLGAVPGLDASIATSRVLFRMRDYYMAEACRPIVADMSARVGAMATFPGDAELKLSMAMLAFQHREREDATAEVLLEWMRSLQVKFGLSPV